jgi:hypothetical protein
LASTSREVAGPQLSPAMAVQSALVRQRFMPSWHICTLAGAPEVTQTSLGKTAQ